MIQVPAHPDCSVDLRTDGSAFLVMKGRAISHLGYYRGAGAEAAALRDAKLSISIRATRTKLGAK